MKRKHNYKQGDYLRLMSEDGNHYDGVFVNTYPSQLYLLNSNCDKNGCLVDLIIKGKRRKILTSVSTILYNIELGLKVQESNIYDAGVFLVDSKSVLECRCKCNNWGNSDRCLSMVARNSCGLINKECVFYTDWLVSRLNDDYRHPLVESRFFRG